MEKEEEWKATDGIREALMNRQFNLLCISALYILRLTSVGITDCKPSGRDVVFLFSRCFH